MIDIPDSMLPKNEQGVLICPKCKELYEKCLCQEMKIPLKKTVVYHPCLRMEKSGRKGKTVTLILKLPNNEDFLQKLTKNIKSSIGSGGTYYCEEGTGVIEIQGDQRKSLEAYFKKNPVFD